MLEKTFTLNEINAIANFVLKNSKSRIILLDGNLGSGKTTLIKAMVKQLGSDDEANSPTFAIVNEYRTPDFPIYHFDLYRLKDFYEALDFGIEEYLSQPDAYVFIEWADIIADILPENSQKIRIIVKENEMRVLQIL